jgi:hypothetical protein
MSGLMFLSLVSMGQNKADTAWKIGSKGILAFSQSSFTNWAAGGDNTITLNGLVDFYAKYEKGNKKWENLLILGFGQTKTGDQEYRKSEDKIDFLSVYGIKASEKWYYSANFNFRSQFAPGYDYPDGIDSTRVKISNFLAPAFISVGLGMEYRPVDYFSVYLSPATARWIIVNDQELADQGLFGVEAATYEPDSLGNPDLTKKITDGETSRFEFGAYVRIMFVKDIAKNINLSTKLELFSDYIENPQNVDVNWDTMINFKVNNWLSANFGLQMVYDDNTPITDKDGNTGPRTQIKQLLGVGLTYSVGR